MNQLLKPSDYIAAAAPVVGALTLAEINAIVGIMGGLTGLAYLLWKWRKEWGKSDTNHPFPRE